MRDTKDARRSFRDAKKRDISELKFTGERVIPGKTSYNIFQEHLNRYAFASGFVEKKLVLDIACGTGYGAEYLFKNGAKEVIGADISKESIYYARNNYLETPFVLADCASLPFSSGSFDIIVSFETLEHIGPYRDYLAECKRVLKDNGVFICSTPNKKIFSDNLERPYNHFHVKEFYPDEFYDLLNGYFVNTRLYGQNNINLMKTSFVELGGRTISKIPFGNGIKNRIKNVLNDNRSDNDKNEYAFLSIDETLDRNYKVSDFKSNLFTAPSYIIAVSIKKGIRSLKE